MALCLITGYHLFLVYWRHCWLIWTAMFAGFHKMEHKYLFFSISKTSTRSHFDILIYHVSKLDSARSRLICLWRSYFPWFYCSFFLYFAVLYNIHWYTKALQCCSYRSAKFLIARNIWRSWMRNRWLNSLGQHVNDLMKERRISRR